MRVECTLVSVDDVNALSHLHSILYQNETAAIRFERRSYRRRYYIIDAVTRDYRPRMFVQT